MLARKGNQTAKAKQTPLPQQLHSKGGIGQGGAVGDIASPDLLHQRYLGNTAVQALAQENVPPPVQPVSRLARVTTGEVQAGGAGEDAAKQMPPNEKKAAAEPPRENVPAPADETEPDVKAIGGHLILAKNRFSEERIRSMTYYDRPVNNDIEWWIDPIEATFDLVIDIAPTVRPKVSARQIAAAGAAVLARETGLIFKDGEGKALVDYLAGMIDRYKLHGPRFYVPVDYPETVLKLFDHQSLRTFIEQKKATASPPDHLDIQLIAAGNFNISAEPAGKAKPGLPRWTSVKLRQVEDLMEKARRQKPPPQDIPDKIVIWYKPENQSWYFNALVNLDTRGKKRVSYPVRLRPEESAEALFERVRSAVPKALQKAKDERKQERARALPAWARRIEREVRRGLQEQRRRDKTATDFPDGMVLVAEPWEAPAAAQPTTKQGFDIYLQIWVERGTAPHTQRNDARIPFALTPQTNVQNLIAYVRRQAAILRQFEHTPLGKQPPLPTGVEITPPGTELALNAFPAEILAQDLRPDQITVTGAKNEFGMLLDYEAVYGGGELRDLYIASKLFQQYIHFFWKIYKVPADLQPAKGERSVPVDWSQRWQWLNETFNAKNRDDPNVAWRNISRLGKPVYESNGPDPKTRVKFPSEAEDAGDYLVFCQTGHAPIGEHDLKRVSSVAYYPVRVRFIKQEAQAAVSQRTEAITAVEAELEAIRAMLDEGGLEGSQKEMFEAVQSIKKVDLKRLKDKEFRTFAENAAEEVAYASTLLGRVQELEKILPGIRQIAHDQAVAPSQQLAQTPELRDLYWYIIWEKKTLPGYKKELQTQIEQMQAYAKRAREFRNKLKPASPYQYSPEVAFVSTLTGHVYPLVMMLGEAPESVKNALSGGTGEGIAYSVVDITSSQTQNSYFGYSREEGPEGHRQAIDNAFENFGEDATYGEGIIAVRIPAGRVGANDRFHPGMTMKTYDSAPGILQKVLWALSIIAAVAGAAALAATGVGAPAAAALFGAIAAGAGAILAVHNISERSSRNKLEWDAEMALDIISIVSVIPLAAGVRVARLPRTVANLRTIRVTEQFVQIYGWGETAATVVLVPTKLAQDIQRIENDPELTPDQRKALIREAKLGAFQTGLMMIGAGAASLSNRAKARLGFDPVDEAGLNQQIELMGLEGWGQYKTLTERGYLDEGGQWTAKARAIAPPEPGAPVRQAPSPAEPLPPPKSRQPTRTTAGMGGEPPGPPQPRRPGQPEGKRPPTPVTRRPVGDYYVEPGSPEYHRLLHEGWSAEMVRSGLKPDLPAIVAKGGKALRRGTFRSDIETPDQAYRIYEEALARAGGREVAIFRNVGTGRYAVTVGTPFEVGPPWKGNWEGVVHYHQNPANILTYRMPAPADVEGTALAAFRAEGRPVTEFVEHPIPGGGRGRVAYTALYKDGQLRITVDTIRPAGKPIKQTFSSLKDYQAEYVQRKRYVDPESEEYKWIMRDVEGHMGESGTRTMAGGRKAKEAGRLPPAEKRPEPETAGKVRPASIDEDEPTKVFKRPPQERKTPPAGGSEPQAPVRTKPSKVQQLPEATVLKLARPDRITAAYLRDVHRTYRNMWADDPSREAGLYHNTVSGDFILVQGNRKAVIVATEGQQSPLSGGKAQRWKQILDAGEDVGRWELVRHYHPPAPGSEFVSDVGRLPSGAVKDMDVIYFESVRADGKARTSTIDYLTPDGPDHTTFGFDPNQPQPFWINYPDPQTGDRTIRRFPDLEAYHNWVRETFHVDPGAVPQGRISGEALPQGARRSPGVLNVSTSQMPNEPPKSLLKPLDRDKALGHHLALDEGRLRTPEGQRIIRVPPELYDAAWRRATEKTGHVGEPPRYGFVVGQRREIVLPDQRPDILDPGGRLRRSTDDPRTNEPTHYHAREFFSETSKLGQEEARYFAEAHLRPDGIVDLDFRLRLVGERGARRSSRLRGQEEFNSALAHFRRYNGEDSVKGIRGDWDKGDNLARFNERFQQHLANKLSRDEAFRQAALETPTGGWASGAGFSEVRRETATYNPNTKQFDHVAVIFQEGAGQAGPSSAPASGSGSIPPAPAGEPSRAPRDAREIAAPHPISYRKPAASLEERRLGDLSRETLRPADQVAQERAQRQLQRTLSAHVGAGGGSIPVIEVEGVKLHDIKISVQGTELRVAYFGIEKTTAPGGYGVLIQQALEEAALASARQIGARSVRIIVETVVNPNWRKKLEGLGYTHFVIERSGQEFGFQAVLSKVLAL